MVLDYCQSPQGEKVSVELLPHCQQAQVRVLMARHHYENVAKVKEKYVLTQGH